MNNLVLYAIIIFIIYHLWAGKNKERYSDEEQKIITECIQAYREYSVQTDPNEKMKKEKILTEKYYSLLKVNPNIFKNGIPDDIKRMI
jgi:hypothetical protein